MSYKTYTTEAIVCGSRANNTSDKSFLLFARDAGMLWASAKSVREERSKQRFALQDFSLVRVSLVRGKSGWRIGSAESEKNYFTRAATKSGRAGVTTAVRLLRQFLHGEIAQPEIFEDAKRVLLESQNLDAENEKKLLELFTLRLLHKLGYISARDSYREVLESEEWWKLEEVSAEAKKAIEKGRQVSHL